MPFLISTFLISLACLSYGFFKYIVENDNQYLFYHGLTQLIDAHAIYFAMYIGMPYDVPLFAKGTDQKFETPYFVQSSVSVELAKPNM